MNRLTSDPAALGGLVTDPRNEIADATGFLPSVSRFLAGMSEALGGGVGEGGHWGVFFYVFISCLIWIRHTLGFPEVKQEIVAGETDTGGRDPA